MRRKHLQFLGAILLVAVPSLAGANRVEVSPTRIELQPSRGSALLQVKNFGAEELRFEILAFSWSQDGTNDMVLEETDDIVFFPAIFSVAPGGSRKIRIASQVPTVDVERAYRLVVKQLPDDVPDGSVTVRILTEFSVPVFVNAPSMEATPPPLRERIVGPQGRLLDPERGREAATTLPNPGFHARRPREDPPYR